MSARENTVTCGDLPNHSSGRLVTELCEFLGLTPERKMDCFLKTPQKPMREVTMRTLPITTRTSMMGESSLFMTVSRLSVTVKM